MKEFHILYALDKIEVFLEHQVDGKNMLVLLRTYMSLKELNIPSNRGSSVLESP